MADTTHHRRKAAYSPVITLGSLLTWVGLVTSVVGVTSYVGDIKSAAAQGTALNAQAIEGVKATQTQDRADRLREREELIRRLDNMDRKLDQIRQTQNSRTPGL